MSNIAIPIGNYVLNGMRNIATIEYAKGAFNIKCNFHHYFNNSNNIKQIQILC